MLDNFNAFFTNKISGEKNQQILTRAYDIFLKQSELLIKSASPSHFFNKRQSLPYAIKQFQIVNYKGIIKTGIAGIPEDTKWIFLTGENGFGKTNILQALIIGLYGERDGNTLLTEGDCQIGIEFLDRDHTQLNNLNNPLEFKSFTHFAAYGPSRLEIQTPLTKNLSEGRSSPTYGLFNPNGILLNIESELSRWYFKDERQYEKIKQILLKLLPHIADLSVDSKTDEILYYEKEPSENGLIYDKPLTFNKLASGYQSLIAIVGDMLLRLIQQQPNEFDELSGIVLIDEFDLHFHPKWQRDLPNKLSALFPKIQFIASTHSIIPFLGAPKESVFLKVTRNKKEGVKLTRVDIDIQNLLPNAILTSPLFDFEQLIPLQE
jgi:predicted ATPase